MQCAKHFGIIPLAMSTLNAKKQESWRMFDQIAPSYDRINGILSLGIHSHWRSQLTAYLPPRPNLQIIDLATGTGDVPLLLAKNSEVAQIIGLDLSQNMLQRGREKILRQNLEKKITLSHGDAVTIPQKDNSADAVTMAFGIRNLSQPQTCLKNIYRVLRSGGRVLILEFSTPANPLWKMLYFSWLRFPLPLLGKWLSRHPDAYQYLNQTIQEFPSGEYFTGLMKEVGFKSPRRKEMTFGSVTLYLGDKP